MPSPSAALKRPRLEIVFFVLLALWVGLALFGVASGLATLIAIAEFFLGAILLFRLGRYIVRQSIWRLRNRLIVTYVLIGVIPVVLILTLVVMGGYIVAGQVAVYLVSSELDRRTQSLNEPAQIMSWATPPTRGRVLNQVAPFIRSHFPRVQMLIHAEEDYRYPEDTKVGPPPAGWPDHSGLVMKDGRYYSWIHLSRNGAELVVLSPVTSRVLSDLVPNLGAVHLIGGGSDRTSLLEEAQQREDEAVRIPPAQNRFDREVTWIAQVSVADWSSPGRMETRWLLVTTRPSAVLSDIFGERFVLGQDSLYGLMGVGVLFLIVEMFSLMAGISMTRTITGAVHNLYLGTEKITAGDFSHRIEVRGKDQLSSLSRSFNSMAENLERLFAVEKEKERLQSELEIAKEVQNQLFPKAMPKLTTMQLTGVCQPARMVSGDYYDYMCIDPHHVAFAIGDVAGKGISAALLMASIQSIMRTQLTAGFIAQAATADGHCASVFCTAHAVSQLNKQLFANTSPEKFATFYFGVYDEKRRMLTYTNAGHLPPILLRGDEASYLEVTGTVVGAFPKVEYEERTLALRVGDMLVAYTDGITEPENEYGEEFGSERLKDVLFRHRNAESEEIIARVMESVRLWTSAPELPDDMTVIVAKIN